MKEIVEQISANKFYIFLGSLIILTISLGLLVWQARMRGEEVEVETVIYQAPTTESSDWTMNSNTDQNAKEASLIVVDIGGAIRVPGVYAMPTGSKLADLVQIAGGFDVDHVDMHMVQKGLNLAQSLSDGQKLYVPYKGEKWTSSTSSNNNESGTSNSETELVSINNADSKTLQTLKGIGEVRAQAIIDNRPYASINDLLTKNVVTQTIFNNIESTITL